MKEPLFDPKWLEGAFVRRTFRHRVLGWVCRIIGHNYRYLLCRRCRADRRIQEFMEWMEQSPRGME